MNAAPINDDCGVYAQCKNIQALTNVSAKKDTREKANWAPEILNYMLYFDRRLSVFIKGVHMIKRG